MGTMICLGVGKMEIDLGKNNIFSDHSVLFKEDDIKQVPYFYANDIDAEDPDDRVIVEYKEGLSRPLSSIKSGLICWAIRLLMLNPCIMSWYAKLSCIA